MKNRFRPFAFPAALFAAQLPVAVWRFRTWDCLPVATYACFVWALASFALAAAVGGLFLLLYWLGCRLGRRPFDRPAETFLVPTLVLSTLLASLFLWLNLGFAFQERALERMDRAWDTANPRTEAEVRALFGEPDWAEDIHFKGRREWCYRPSSRFPTLRPAPPWRVEFASDGTVLWHGRSR